MFWSPRLLSWSSWWSVEFPNAPSCQSQSCSRSYFSPLLGLLEQTLAWTSGIFLWSVVSISSVERLDPAERAAPCPSDDRQTWLNAIHHVPPLYLSWLTPETVDTILTPICSARALVVINPVEYWLPPLFILKPRSSRSSSLRTICSAFSIQFISTASRFSMTSMRSRRF